MLKGNEEGSGGLKVVLVVSVSVSGSRFSPEESSRR